MKSFKIKLIVISAFALILFVVGTVKYMGKPYKRDVYHYYLKQERKYIGITQQAIDSAQKYQCLDDEITTDYYINKAIQNYHISDSLHNQAIKYYVK